MKQAFHQRSSMEIAFQSRLRENPRSTRPAARGSRSALIAVP